MSHSPSFALGKQSFTASATTFSNMIAEVVDQCAAQARREVQQLAQDSDIRPVEDDVKITVVPCSNEAMRVLVTVFYTNHSAEFFEKR